MDSQNIPISWSLSMDKFVDFDWNNLRGGVAAVGGLLEALTPELSSTSSSCRSLLLENLVSDLSKRINQLTPK